jgi:hypothetical protein
MMQQDTQTAARVWAPALCQKRLISGSCDLDDIDDQDGNQYDGADDDVYRLEEPAIFLKRRIGRRNVLVALSVIVHDTLERRNRTAGRPSF